MIVAALASLATCGWLGRESLLHATASLWIVSDPITRADTIVVVGGNYQERPRVAAELYHQCLAEKVLVSQTHESRGGTSNTELSRTGTSELGVPPTAMENFGTGNRNTRDEAVALR
jgi:hypothetical protein